MKAPTRAGILLQKAGQRTSSEPTYILHHFDPADVDARDFVRLYLVEGGRTFDLGQGRAVMFHRAHVPSGQDHLHFLIKRDKLYALNRDGTAHDASHGRQMHRWAMDAVRSRYPDFQLPPQGLIESMLIQASLLVEASGQQELIRPNLLIAALNKASMLSP
jgi:hypothetical protein